MKLNYFVARLKHSLKLYPSIMLGTFITVAMLSVGLYLVVSNTIGTQESNLISVGIVDDENDSYLEMGLSVLSGMDTSVFPVELIQMTRHRAQEAVLNDEIHGYMDIPENFIDGIMQGKNYPATYIIKNGAVNFGTVITGEIVEIVSDLVIKSQSNTYNMQKIAEIYGEDRETEKKTEQLNLIFAEQIIRRNRIYDIKTLSATRGISAVAYYLCGMTIFLLMLWGISCYSLFNGSDICFCSFLSSKGISPSRQILCEFASFLFLTVATVMIFASVAVVVAVNMNLKPDELDGMKTVDVIAIFLRALPVIVMICSMHMFVFEAVRNTVAAVILEFVLAVGMGYVSGCFYPNNFFPDTIEKIAAMLPAGTAFSFLKDNLSMRLSVESFVGVFAYFAFFVAATYAVRKYRLTGDCR